MSGKLQVDRECDQVLLYAVVELTLDLASVGIRGDNEPLERCAQLLDLDAQLLELPLHVELFGLQVDRLLRVSDEFVRHWAAGVKGPSIPSGWEGSLPSTCL